jgi:hypothetical protein
LLSILAVVSLLTSPMMTSGGAEAMSAAVAADASDIGMPDMGMPDMGMPDMGMSAHAMPCCPLEKPVVPDCAKSCPLAILCLAKCFPNAPAASASLLIRFAVADMKTPGDDSRRDRLPDPPPLKPPRT